MSEATVRCPKCGHEGIVITDLLNSDLLLIADSQAAKIERLRSEVDDCPYCTQIRLAARDEEISRLTTAWHVEMETEAAMRAEVERLRKVETYYRDTIGKCNTHIQEQEQVIERLRGELDECRRLLRELVNRLESDPVWWDHSLACEYWCEQAAKVAGGSDAS